MAAGEVFPEAEVTLDRFYIAKLLNEALDQVRREEQKEQPELKRTRYLWLRNPQDLRRRDAEWLAQLLPEEVGLHRPGLSDQARLSRSSGSCRSVRGSSISTSGTAWRSGAGSIPWSGSHARWFSTSWVSSTGSGRASATAFWKASPTSSKRPKPRQEDTGRSETSAP